MIKPDRIKRSVTASQNDRVAGDAPNIGRVARMPGTGMPKGQKRKRRRSERSARKSKRKGGRVILNWMILIGIVGGIMGGMALYTLNAFGKRKPGVASEQRLEIDKVELEVSKNPQFVSPSESEALALVKAALAAREPSQLVSHFDLGNQTAETAVTFLTDLEKNDGRFVRMDWLSNMNANGLNLEGVLVRFLDDEKERSRIAFLKPGEEGGWKVDFESLARIVTPGWEELMAGKGDHAMVRVFLAEDSYYNGPFSDEKQWKCYGIGSPDTPEVFQGYCKLGTPQATAVEALLAKGQKINRAILEIRRVKDGLASQFEIIRVLAEDWVMGEKAFDQGFK